MYSSRFKQSAIFLSLFAAALLPSSEVSAQIYQCNGVYTNRRCGSDAKAVELPRITRFEAAAPRTPARGALPAEDPAARTRLGAVEPAPAAVPAGAECRPVPDGLDVRLLDVHARIKSGEDRTATYLTGSVKNFSSEHLLSDLFVAVSPPNGEPQLHYLADSLVAGGRTRFSVRVDEDQPAAAAPVHYRVALVHERPKSCEAKVVNTASATVSSPYLTENEVTLAEPTGRSIEQAQRASLDSISRYIDSLRNQFAPADRSPDNQEFMRELNRVQGELESTCDRSSLLEEVDTRDQCQALLQQLSALEE